MFSFSLANWLSNQAVCFQIERDIFFRRQLLKFADVIETVIKTILRQIITHCAGTQDIFKKFFSCCPCGRKSGMKTVAFLLRLSICSCHIDIHNFTKTRTFILLMFEILLMAYM